MENRSSAAGNWDSRYILEDFRGLCSASSSLAA
jgi:hypothetical protein